MSRIDPTLFGSDWLSRVTVPDVYPRREDPYRPSVMRIPGMPPPEMPPVSPEQQLYDNITTPAMRPSVYERAVNLQLSIGLTPVNIQPTRFECDAILIDVPSTAANSVFFGFGNSITTASGIEVRPGLPQFFSPDNTREQWELQRSLEVIANLLAMQAGLPPMPTYRAPRVVFDASDYFLVAGVAGPTTVAVMLFYIPEMQ